ncbi:hypothetical protein ACWDKQ_05735 [Saccharopolyspora sp. NPDC000995]
MKTIEQLTAEYAETGIILCEPKPYFVECQIVTGEPEGWIFEANVSVLIKESTEQYRSYVAPYLDLFCTTVIDSETRKDKTMAFGRATLTRYRMHEECPGERVEHRCISKITE